MKLDVNKKSDELGSFEEFLKSKVVGQSDALKSVVSVYQSYLAKLNQRTRPIANILLLGPTGVGKTWLCEVVAQFLKVDLIKINCGEFDESHKASNLTGAPQGYVGYGDNPMITASMLEKSPNVVLFDEIEKAHPKFTSVLLALLDKGELVTSKGNLNFTNSFVFFTSNIGSSEVAKLHSGLGFQQESFDLDKKISNVSISALHKEFKPEFINRLDKYIVFNTLTEENLRDILNRELGFLQGRIMLCGIPFVFVCTPEAKDQLMRDGYDPKYGARHLKRSVRENIEQPLSSIIASKQVITGDFVKIDYKDGQFAFDREESKHALNAVNDALDKLSKEIKHTKKDKDEKKKTILDESWFNGGV